MSMATGRKGSTSKGGGVRFPDNNDPPGSPTRRDDQSNNSTLIAIPEKDGSFLVKVGFLRSQQCYEIVFTLPELPALGKDLCLLLPSTPISKPNLKVAHITPTPEGVTVTCEYTTHQEGVLQEEITLGSKGSRDSSLRITLQARVMDRHHGTPMLLEGVRCLATGKEHRSKPSKRT
ncbi:adipose-secreted signaling protein [Aplochiton taeniatus]